MPVFFVLAARMNTCQLAQIPLLPNKFYRSILAFLASQRSAQARPHPMPCAINLPLAARSHARGMFAAQIPIAKPAARPTERPSRDFVPWRFSDAGHRSAWLAHRCRRPKTCTNSDFAPIKRLSKNKFARALEPAKLRSVSTTKPAPCSAGLRKFHSQLRSKPATPTVGRWAYGLAQLSRLSKR
jgi:hypothetical protein